MKKLNSYLWWIILEGNQLRPENGCMDILVNPSMRSGAETVQFINVYSQI